MEPFPRPDNEQFAALDVLYRPWRGYRGSGFLTEGSGMDVIDFVYGQEFTRRP